MRGEGESGACCSWSDGSGRGEGTSVVGQGSRLTIKCQTVLCLEHITVTSTVRRDQGKQALAQRMSGANCKAGALPAELHPRVILVLSCADATSSPVILWRGCREETSQRLRAGHSWHDDEVVVPAAGHRTVQDPLAPEKRRPVPARGGLRFAARCWALGRLKCSLLSRAATGGSECDLPKARRGRQQQGRSRAAPGGPYMLGQRAAFEFVEGLVVDGEPLVAAWATTAPPPMSALDRARASRACRRRCRMFASPPLRCRSIGTARVKQAGLCAPLALAGKRVGVPSLPSPARRPVRCGRRPGGTRSGRGPRSSPDRSSGWGCPSRRRSPGSSR